MAESQSEIAEHTPTPVFALIAVLWLILILACFFRTDIVKSPPFSRWDFWVYVPDLFDPPPAEANEGHSGWQFFPQRFDLLAAAGFILCGAWGAGCTALRWIGTPLAGQSLPRAGRLEDTVFAFGLGLSTLSLVTLGAGLCGWLSRPVLGGIVALFFVAGVVLRLMRISRTNNPGGPILFVSVPTPGSPYLQSMPPNQRTHPGAYTPGSPSLFPKSTFLLLAIPAVPFLLAMLLGSLLPSTDFDVNEYHFEGPKEFFQAGRISFLEHNVYTSFPFGTEMLTLLAMVLSGDWYRGALAGKCVLMCFGPLTALALLAAGRCCFGKTPFGTLAGTCAALLYLAAPWVFRISTIAYAEGGLCFYLAAALLAVIIALECASPASGHEPAAVDETGPVNPSATQDRTSTSPQALQVDVPGRGEWRHFLLAGLLAGSAMACKYPALLSVVVPLGTAVLFYVGRSRRSGGLRWSTAAGFGLGVLITVGPWLLKNLIETGNPVYPLAYRLFDGRDWDPALDERWRKAHSPSTFAPASLVDLACEIAFRSTWVSPLLVGLALWSLFASRWRRRIGWLWVYVGWLFLSCWLFTHRIDRFWVPLLPAVALLAGAGAAWWWLAFPRRWARAALVMALAAVGVFQLAFICDRHGLCGYNDFLRDLDEAKLVAARKTAPEVLYLNEHLPAGAKVLSVGDAEMFEARFPVVYNTVFDRSVFEDWFAAQPGDAGAHGAMRDPTAIRKKLADQGITHVYVNWLEILRYRVPGSYGYTDFVTPERFVELKKLGVLAHEWPISSSTMEVARLDAPWQEELNHWGAGLKARRDDQEDFTTFQVFPVVTDRSLANDVKLPAVAGDTNPKRERGHQLTPSLARRVSMERTIDRLQQAGESKPFRIQVVDDETGRGVPLVELTTVNNIRYVTDSNGIVAFDEPGLMDQSVFFHVHSHGYEFPKDGFGFRGQALKVAPGGTAALKLKRLNVAHRLYRMTGAGVYRDSELSGVAVPIRQPLINGLVTGSDSVVNTVYDGKIYWFWGDTNRPGYPLGNYHVPGAISELPGKAGLDPQKGVDLTYFVDKTGFAKPTAQMPGDGPTWIDGLVVLPGNEGRERMFAAYVKVKPPLDVYEHGLAEFDNALSSFKKVKAFDNDAPVYPGGHPFVARDGAVDFVYFSRPYPLVRVRAAPGSLVNLDEYEAFTCLKQGSRLNKPAFDRGPDGKLRYSWKSSTPAVGPAEQAKLIAAKQIQPEEALLRLADRDSGQPVFAHNGSVYWNEYRQRWVMIAVEKGGASSHLGEVWYSEADSPLGPWAYAVKIVTHDRYSFYNPKQHPMFDQREGRSIFFEGTYTHTFSGNTDQTPRYDYNQMMYRLDLDDPRASVPVAFYQRSESIPNRFRARTAKTPVDAMTLHELPGIAFFACNRPANGLLALCESQSPQGMPALTVTASPGPAEKVVCFVLPTDAAKPQAMCVPLYEYAADDGRRAYATDADPALAGFKRQAQPICRVWKNPWKK